MGAKELMIGDWVHFHLGDYANPQGVINFKIRDCFDLARCADFRPIILTPEILEKNGFEERESEAFGGCLCYEHPNSLVNIFWRDSEDTMTAAGTETTIPSLWCMEITWDGCYYDKQSEHCFYVHELQRALRLCGLTDLADNFKV